MLTLLIDADDTLWENNIHYEDCVADFVELMVREGFDAGEVEETADAVERRRIPEVGYAPEEFARSLVITYQRLCERHGRSVRDEVSEAAMQIGLRVVRYPIILLDGVETTLSQLSERYQLLLLTKGDRATQEDKVVRSGLGHFFDAVHVVEEKDADVFRDLIELHGLHPRRTWMVGNSPRSDINPAVEAGIGAVFVPHPNTWGLEIEEVVDSDRVTVVHQFEDLAAFFAEREEAIGVSAPSLGESNTYNA
ncbi:MAG: HAD family hydrolase [Anaerolineae bacterium]|jgi:putative hydrolase of the HAD superfamily